MLNTRKGTLLVVVITLAVAIQTVIIVRDFLLPLQPRLQGVKRLSSWERSSRLSFGDRFTEYLTFLTIIIPEDATVVIPPVSIDSTYGNQGIMQFFLFPRNLTNCPVGMDPQKCVNMYTGEDSYILAIPGFPPDAALIPDKRFVSHDEHWGVYAPIP